MEIFLYHDGQLYYENLSVAEIAKRYDTTSKLVHSIQRFGHLISASQEARLMSMLHEDHEFKFRDSVEAIVRCAQSRENESWRAAR